MISYSTTITACQKGGASEEAVRLLEKMQQMQAEEAKQAAAGTTAEPGGRYKPPPVAPNAYSYTAAMSALSDAGKWEDALKTFEQAPPEMQQSEALVNAAVSAAAAGKQWRRCVELIRNLRAAGKTPQSSSFNMAIGACAAAQQPASALALLRSMRAAGVRRLRPRPAWDSSPGAPLSQHESGRTTFLDRVSSRFDAPMPKERRRSRSAPTKRRQMTVAIQSRHVDAAIEETVHGALSSTVQAQAGDETFAALLGEGSEAVAQQLPALQEALGFASSADVAAVQGWSMADLLGASLLTAAMRKELPSLLNFSVEKAMKEEEKKAD